MDPGIVAKVVHGGKVPRQKNNTATHYIDFSANFNPFPPRVAWSPDLALLADYPDDEYLELREAYARLVGRAPEEICVGNGSAEIIRTFCHTVIREGMPVRIDPPTFGEYALSARLAGGTVAAGSGGAGVRFLCNPNNPTGYLTPRSNIVEMLAAAEKADRVLFVDEAFIELADPRQSVADIASPHLFVMRSLTKEFAVPGIRFGFGIGDPALVSRMEIMRPPWSVNSFAESFALAAARKYRDLGESRHRIENEREWICSRLLGAGIAYEPSATNFIMLYPGQPAAPLTAALRTMGILVRDCTSFGKPEAIRVAVRTREENRLLLEALFACVR
ncbi:MAG: histidinol-phosphate aminotransferase family protein [Methanomicrobiales archaeon]|nr:histidinol-phosphate aminotransferase family protein [Methanomicrobiales archaeon]